MDRRHKHDHKVEHEPRVFSSLKRRPSDSTSSIAVDVEERTDVAASSLEVDMRYWIKLIADKGMLVFLSFLIFFSLLGAGQCLYKLGLPFAFVALLECAVVFGGVFLIQRRSLLGTKQGC